MTISEQNNRAIHERAEWMQSKWSVVSRESNLDRLREQFRQLARDKDGNTVSFAKFSGVLSQELAGFVLTAHPTFALSEAARCHAHALISGDDVEDEAQFALHSSRSPTLDEELSQSECAILNIRRAIRDVNGVALDVAAELYSDDYLRFAPGFVTVASWVGFDLDGRTDIGWAKSLEFRYRSALTGLAEFSGLVEEITQSNRKCSDQPEQDVIEMLTVIRNGIDTFKDCFELGLRSLMESGESENGVARLNRLAMENRERKQAAMAAVDRALDMIDTLNAEPETLRRLVVLRAEWHAVGLGLSHVHFRLNAVQLHNAIRSEIDLDRAPDQSASRRHYLHQISRLLDSVEPVNVHYGTLAAERTTAKRLFMLAAQFQKHFDGRTPIRLLIAESDTPFTLLTALYFARLFAVDDHVEISPLFETAQGLQRGDRVIAELLDKPHFLEYVRSQGRFTVQLGFSDSGRYIGQLAANLAIERFKLRLVRLWQERQLADVQLLVFDTHGESIGRGAHPDSLRDRFLTTHTPLVRSTLSGLSAPHKHEVSFQGGDGYFWFASEQAAVATLTEFLLTRFGGDSEQNQCEDRFYTDSDWSLDFFLTVREFQDRVARHPGYLALLDSFAPNLLYPTGSRATKRQSGGQAVKGLVGVNQIRAIPHNAMLQQLGYLANVVGGAGMAIGRAPGRYQECLRGSPRLQRMMRMIDAAGARSSVTSLMGYAELIDPTWWLNEANAMPSTEDRAAAHRLSSILESAFDHAAIGALIRELRRDEAWLQEQQGIERRQEIEKLHTARIKEIRFIYLKVMAVPRFSTRTNVSLDDLIIRLLKLEVPTVVSELRQIFPAESQVDDYGFGEQSTYESGAGGYAREHAEIFDPIEQAYVRILESSATIALKIGSFG